MADDRSSYWADRAHPSPEVQAPTADLANPNLRACPDCGAQVSRSALSCPSCGHPFAAVGAQICPFCHRPTVVKSQGTHGARETTIALVLLALAILPGLAYYFDVSRVPYCTNCQRRVRDKDVARAVARG